MPDQTPESLTTGELFEEIAQLIVEGNRLMPSAHREIDAIDHGENEGRVRDLSRYVLWAGNALAALTTIAEDRARIAELDAQLEDARRDVGAARGTAGALQARVVELRLRERARDARIAELEAAQGERVGYAVTVEDAVGRFIQFGAVLDRDEAERRARVYADQGGRLVELREVSDE